MNEPEQVAFSNMVSQWGDRPYGELSVFLVHLRFAAAVHQVHHWTAKGDPFMGDHLLFEELYKVTTEEVDSIAERSVGLGDPGNVSLPLQWRQTDFLVQQYGPSTTLPRADELARRSLDVELRLLRCASYVIESLHERNTWTRGLDNLIAGVEDRHEVNVYKLRQRCNVAEKRRI